MNRQDFFKRVAAVAGFSLLPTLETKSESITRNNNSRHLRYISYEGMDCNPNISTLLDELATNVASRFKIYSSNPVLQTRVNYLFKDILNIEVNNEMWIRNTAKYGNNFLYVNIHDREGVIGARQLVNHNLMIKDSPYNKNLSKDSSPYNIVNGSFFYYTSKYQKYRRLFTYHDGRKPIEFQNHEVIDFTAPYLHQEMLPYGTSMLEKYKTNSVGGLYFTDREVMRFEQSISQAYTKLVIIHLYSMGYRDAELTNFTISFD